MMGPPAPSIIYQKFGAPANNPYLIAKYLCTKIGDIKDSQIYNDKKIIVN